MVRCITCNVYHMQQFCRFFNCLAWFDTVEFNCLPYPNNEMYDIAVIADRFHCQLNRFGIRVLIGLSLHHHAHIAYEIDTAKIIAACCRFSYYLHDLMRLNSIVCYVQVKRCTMMWSSMIDSDINWLCLKFIYWQSYLESLILILHMRWPFKKSQLVRAWCEKRSLMQDCSEALI